MKIRTKRTMEMGKPGTQRLNVTLNGRALPPMTARDVRDLIRELERALVKPAPMPNDPGPCR